MTTKDKWIDKPIKLTDELVSLVPLRSLHIPALCELAQDQRIWQHYVVDGSNRETLRQSLTQAMKLRTKGTTYPFTIKERASGKIIGSTRFLDIQYEHRKLEIGWTWLHPDYWGRGYNSSCKQLLLAYCFNTLGSVRVQLRTDELNLRSRRAIEKIGGKFEGVVRHDMIRENGTFRDSACYSLIPQEWRLDRDSSEDSR